ncbi:class III poly(R)-hydroxyalkanoic acid synthase subunit PhaC [Thiofilum flexile]|uniref:class III poly(R)-hydroxyalkanoic acid synthase subunit PhaC n=1 Tax=Thiofilum flexile TaxID=125627 RepID=UPI00036A1698|nr:class III poly(R)-hydroxyalkanoic acid synthase subunit PhaC [Thiofilum flexile]
MQSLLETQQLLQEIAQLQAKLAQAGAGVAKVSLVTGVTPYDEIVYQEDKLRLLYYRPETITLHEPLLIVYALVNRPYMLDLQQGRSLLQGLLARGQAIYLLDWGYPDAVDRYLTLDDYINGYLHRCVQQVLKRHTLKAVNLLGICQGGVLSLCYSALHPTRVKNLITMVTPVDFHTADNQLSHEIRPIDIDLLVDTFGNIPGALLNTVFARLKPYQLTHQKYFNIIHALDQPAALQSFVLMEQWINDSPDQAGEAFRQFVKLFFQNNQLVTGGAVIGQHPIDLTQLTLPILNIYATEDHIVPPSASRALQALVASSDYEEFSFNGGHIGIYVSTRAQTQVPDKIINWLLAHQV